MITGYFIYGILLIVLVVAAGMISHRRASFPWSPVFTASILSAILIILLTKVFVGRVWDFTPDAVSSLYFLDQPFDHMVFLFAVSLTGIILWQVFMGELPQGNTSFKLARTLLALLIAPGAFTHSFGKEYFGLSIVLIGACGFLDAALRTHVFLRAKSYAAIPAALIVGYLLNLYPSLIGTMVFHETFAFGVTIGPVPFEASFFTAGHMLLAVLFYERLQGQRTEG